MVTGKSVLVALDFSAVMFMVGGLTGFGMQVFKVLSIRYEKPSVFAVISNLTLVYGILFDTFVTGISTSPMGWFGGALVISSISYFSLKKGVSV